jgi:hypothetical protein
LLSWPSRCCRIRKQVEHADATPLHIEFVLIKRRTAVGFRVSAMWWSVGWVVGGKTAGAAPCAMVTEHTMNHPPHRERVMGGCVVQSAP